MSQLTLSPDVQRLAPEQRKQFSQAGYLANVPLFDADSVTHLQQRFKELCDLLPDGVNISRINQWHKANKWVYDLCHTPAILDYVEDLLGPDFFHWAASFFCKYPGDHTEVPWHQDAQYWPLSPHKAVTVWLAIYDTDEDNGAMQVVRGSHRVGEIAHVPVNGEQYMLGQKVVESAIDSEQVVSLNLKAGQISLHDDAIIHGSPANTTTDHMRAGLTMRYSATDVRCDLSVWPHFESYPARGENAYHLNPVGKVPTEDGFPVRADQVSADFTRS